MSLNWHKADGKFGGKLMMFKKVKDIENGTVYTHTEQVGELPAEADHVKLVATVSPTGKFADHEYHVVSGKIPIGK
jgi:hypothetical protein